MNNRFSDEVCQHLGCYVYRLVDPRDGQTFYVGKGSGNRVYSHAKNELADILTKKNYAASGDDIEEDTVSLKSERIRGIVAAGLEVVSIIHRHGMDDHTAFEVEGALIDAYPDLTNIQGGHASNGRGCMAPEQIVEQYELPVIDVPPSDRLILFNINKIENAYDRHAVYEQTRVAWRASIVKAKKAKYVLGVERGVVRGVFVAAAWKTAMREHFPGRLLEDMPLRIGFIGEPAADDVWNFYVGKRGKRIAVDGMRHVQNPVRYWNI